MGDFETNAEDSQYEILRRRFEHLQTKMIGLKNTLAILRSDVLVALLHWRAMRAKIKLAEDELRRLHQTLSGSDEDTL